MQFVGGARLGPGLGAHLGDGHGVEPSQLRRVLGREKTPLLYRQGATFLRGGVVEKGIGFGGEDGLGQGRWRGQVAGDDFHFALFQAGQQVLQTFDVHGFI